MTSIWYVAHPFLVGAIILTAITSDTESVRASNGDEALLTACEAYLANREAFSRFKCRFRASAGFANSVDDAVKRGAHLEPVTAEGIWVVDGENIRYELEVNQKFLEAEMQKVTKGAATSLATPFPSMKYVGNSRLALSYSSLLGHAHVGPPDPKLGISRTPISMGVMASSEEDNPSSRIKKALKCHWALQKGPPMGASKAPRPRWLCYG